MNQFVKAATTFRTAAALFLPLTLWGAVWLGIGSETSGGLVGFRAILPFLAAFLAVLVVLARVSRRQPMGFRIVSPLGFAFLYGLVGLVAAFNSPDGSLALRWVVLYLSAPLVLWAIVWGSATVDLLRRLINITWLVIIGASIALFVVAATKFDLLSVIADPSVLFTCPGANWYDLTSGQIRDTGVGRYAAIAAIIAIGGIWRKTWWPIWSLVFFISFTLLIFTGARGGLGGFAAGSILMMAVYGGRRTLAAGVLVLVVGLLLASATDTLDETINQCILHVSGPVESSEPTIPTGPAIALSGSSLNLKNSPKPPQTPAQQAVTSTSEAPSQPPTPTQPPAQQAVTSTSEAPSQPPTPTNARSRRTSGDFFKLTGRVAVWKEGLKLFRDSPILGYGFHADRVILNTHMHNSVMQALVQTGLAGTIPFLAAILFGWVSLIKTLRNLSRLPLQHKHLVIQTGAILAFLTVRSIPESTGAFFGVDWLILAPILLYLNVISSNPPITEDSS